jgi:hypothetical protein
LLKKPQQHSFPIAAVQLVHGGVEHWAQTIPADVALRRGEKFLHGVGLLFARVPALLGSPRVGGGKMRTGIKPPDERSVMRQRARLSREIGKHCLRDILCSVRIADLAVCGRVDEIEMPSDELCERVLSSLFGIALQQLGIIHHRLSPTPAP